MNDADYWGKWILGEGDLKPRELIKADFFTHEELEHLNEDGMVFDNEHDAMLASETFRMMAYNISHHTMMREEDIAEAYPPRKRIYISGPISGHDIDVRRKSFKEIQEHLEAQGYEVVNPMENGLPAEATPREHMKRDIELLMTCDFIYMMRRWTHSKGCKVEFDVATAIGLPVFFEESGEITKFE